MSAPLQTTLERLSADVARAYPGTVTVFLDAGFPLLEGFPLLPHLSHDDGRKLDSAYYYATKAGTYLPGRTKSPIGYPAFEEPRPGDPAPCLGRGDRLTLWWSLNWLQPHFQSSSSSPNGPGTL